MKKLLLSILNVCFLNSHWSNNLTIVKLDQITLNSLDVKYVAERSNDKMKVVKCNGCDVMFFLSSTGYVREIDVVEN